MKLHTTHTQTTRRFTFIGAALLLGAGNAMAASHGDAQEQARALLTGVHNHGIQASPVQSPTYGSADSAVDPQIRAQWLLAGRPDASTAQPHARESLSATSSSGVVGVDAWEMARRLLTGKGT